MKLIPDWIKPRTATVGELQSQLEAARAAHAEAEAETSRARAAFDDDPAAGKRLLAAREAETLASEHVERARRLLESAEQKAAAEQRAGQEKRRAELTAQLAHAAKQRRLQPLLDAEVRAALALVDARLASRNAQLEIGKLEHELWALTVDLDGAEWERYRPADTEPGWHDLHEALEAARKEIAIHDARDPRLAYIEALTNGYVRELPGNMARGLRRP